MKNARKFIAGVAVVSLGSMSFSAMQSSGIIGKVSPADNVNAAWAISGKDTLTGVLVDSEVRFNSLKPGIYDVMIDAKPPYKDQSVSGITVVAGKTTDMGNVSLSE